MLFSCQINSQVKKYLKNTVYFFINKSKGIQFSWTFLHKKFSFSIFCKKKTLIYLVLQRNIRKIELKNIIKLQ